ncbi:helix-turn-helix transcriptional regulator [Pseudomonas sp. 39004]|uniref:helix-turn-helix domain-containing protein n=1 Tax=Pseudomonas sp. 39004 TaxID=2967213 RepID=UPI002363FC36|nr:helix-turn-helix transcriptional regulator [Pseudomonas sp. 39004]MDD1960079.1 helix-turn-helix transcriptional regulator [Pseudomonas sp. 39004]
MTSHDLDQYPLRLNLDEEQTEVIAWLMDYLPLSFRDVHCAPARNLLGWKIGDLSSASGVTPQAIQRLENGAQLNPVSMQALAFALEAEGLVFFPGHPPLKGENCRGATKDPRSRDDHHQLE